MAVPRAARAVEAGGGHAGGNEVEVAKAALFARPQESHLARVTARQELQDVVHAHPPLALLAGDHLQPGAVSYTNAQNM